MSSRSEDADRASHPLEKMPEIQARLLNAIAESASDTVVGVCAEKK